MKKIFLLSLLLLISIASFSQMTGGSGGNGNTGSAPKGDRPIFHHAFYMGLMLNFNGGGMGYYYRLGLTPIKLGTLFFFSKEGFANNKFSVGLDAQYISPTLLFDQYGDLGFKNNFELGPCFSYNPVGKLIIDATYRLGYAMVITDGYGGGFTNTIGANLRLSALLVGIGVNITPISDNAFSNLYGDSYIARRKNLSLLQLTIGFNI